jgi:arylformamidase
VVAVGGRESDEFKRQSQLIADAWKPQVREHLVLPDLNHFSVVDAFAERSNPLYEGTLALFK